MRPSRMNAIGGASGEIPTWITGGAAAGPVVACRAPAAHPSIVTTASRTVRRPTTPPIDSSSTSAFERDLHAFGRRLRLDPLIGRVQRDAHVVAVLHARDPLATAESTARGDRGLRPPQ